MKSDNLAQLKWACRRGMLELDVLLGNFLEEVYPSLSPDHQAAFVALLKQSDPEIFAWLMGHQEPDDEELKVIVNKMRHHARSLR